MQSASQAIFEEWSPPFFLTLSMLLAAAVYTRGWFLIRRTRPAQFPGWRLGCFLLGMGILWISIASPLDGFADALLSAHMVEHLLLMSFVPPLVLLGQPVVPMLRGLPRIVTRKLLGPLIRRKSLRQLTHWLTTPLVAWLAMNLTLLAWHIPAAYDFALENERWHDFEHFCFLGTSILFWWPLLRPWPARSSGLGWFMLPYLAFADIVNTILSAFLAFCERPVYAYYLKQPNGFGISPMTDQRAGAAVMWVVGSIVFLVPAVIITFRLFGQRAEPQESRAIRQCS
jgi:cytochrome c oxidase assembly factor CtaG